MSDLEVAKLYTVSDPLDRPVEELSEGETAVEIQFNPSSLKVALANSLKENERSGNTRAAQYIDKSSSTLTVELIFDTTDRYFNRESESGETEEARVDVRSLTGAIALEFMHSESVGDDTVAPQRCLFAWGSFAFVGIMETFDETLDFFSAEGTPLRATVALKLTESRFQFRTEEAKAAERDTPTIGGSADSVSDANSNAGKDEKEWRDTAMYNGEESLRLPSNSALSVPSASATASLKASASLGGGISGGFSAGIGGGTGIDLGGAVSGGFGAGIGGGLDAGASGGFSAGTGGGLAAGLSGGMGASGGVGGGLSTSVDLTPPAFNFGASASLGTGIPGAFSADIQAGGGISAGSIVSGGVQLHSDTDLQGTPSFHTSTSSVSGVANTSSSASAQDLFNASASAQASSGVGFD